MFFVDIERIQYIAIMTVAAFIFFYVKVPPIFVLLFVTLSWSILYKNTAINEANRLLHDTTFQYKKAPIKVAHDNIITAEIITLVNNKNVLSFDVMVSEINNKPLSLIQPKLALRWISADYAYPGELGIGQVWRFKIRLNNTSVHSDDNTISSYKSRLLSRHIQYNGLIVKGEIISPDLSIRGRLYQKFKAVLPDQANPMLFALTFGDRSYIKTKLWTQFKLLGIGHLVAISGLHIGLIFGFCYVCSLRMLRLCRCDNQLAISLTVSLGAALFYAWIAGFSLPALRAIVLLCIHCLYRFQYYKVKMFQLFAFMLLVTLLLDPLTMFSLSFWLSFSAMAAVFILVWFIQKEPIVIINKAPAKQLLKNGFHKLKRLCYSQIMLTLFILPLQITIFSGFSWISVLINLIFIPVFSVLILPALLTAVMLLPVMPQISRILIEVVNELLNMIQKMWDRLTVNDIIWIELDGVLNLMIYQSSLLIFVLLISGLVFKPLRMVLHCLTLLLLPLFCYSYVT